MFFSKFQRTFEICCSFQSLVKFFKKRAPNKTSLDSLDLEATRPRELKRLEKELQAAVGLKGKVETDREFLLLEICFLECGPGVGFLGVSDIFDGKFVGLMEVRCLDSGMMIISFWIWDIYMVCLLIGLNDNFQSILWLLASFWKNMLLVNLFWETCPSEKTFIFKWDACHKYEVCTQKEDVNKLENYVFFFECLIRSSLSQSRSLWSD